ncbi:MAG: 6-carboxytetrahydropterin synthase [Terriglobia bacterium]
MLYLTRRYRFAASHRLDSPALSAEENARVYGKCNSPYGHGHNYALDVTMEGPVNEATGMVIDLGALDQLVQQEILDRFDHAHLNFDAGLFAQKAPTTENLCAGIYTLLREKLEALPARGAARLHRVRLEETRSNYFEYEDQSV